MNSNRFLVLSLLCLTSLVRPGFADAAQPGAVAYKELAGPSPVESARYDWFDAKRDRKVPVKIYFPKTGEGPFPVIVFSHGLGGSREGYEYLGRHWASWGYVSVHVQHLGSDTAVWQDAPPADRMQNMRRSAANLANARNRPLDVSYTLDELEKLNRDDPVLKHRLDLNRVGVGGHSFGAFTTLAIAGQRFVALGAGKSSLADPRVKAAMPMSAPVPLLKSRLDEAFGGIGIPCLHMTGTKDSSPIGETTAEERRLPYDHIHGADQYLVTFKDGDHMIFSGRGKLPGGEKDAHFQKYILMCSTAFWDAYLKEDSQAKTWLTGGGFKNVLGDEGVWEQKLK